MTISYPLTKFIALRLDELNLTRPKLVQKMGYENITKGLRRLDACLAGDYRRADKQFLDSLNDALELEAGLLMKLYQQSFELIESKHFRPHAYFKTERAVPSPIFACAWGGFHLQKKLIFPKEMHASQYIKFTLDHCPKYIPTFGRVIGFRIHYDLHQAQEFTCDGEWLTDLNILPSHLQVSLRL